METARWSYLAAALDVAILRNLEHHLEIHTVTRRSIAKVYAADIICHKQGNGADGLIEIVRIMMWKILAGLQDHPTMGKVVHSGRMTYAEHHYDHNL